MSCSDSLPVTVGALASAIAQVCTEEELPVLAALFTQLGDSLELILAARDRDCLPSSCSTSCASD